MVIIVKNGGLIQGILFNHEALIMKFKYGNSACIDSCHHHRLKCSHEDTQIFIKLFFVALFYRLLCHKCRT